MSLDISLTLDGENVYGWNITHNLNRMAIKAGLYNQLWRPEEWDMDKQVPTTLGKPMPTNFMNKAHQLIPHLEEGIKELKGNPDFYRLYDAYNEWGTYDQFVPHLEELLENLKLYPHADLSAYR